MKATKPQQTALTVYACRRDSDGIREFAQNAFQDIIIGSSEKDGTLTLTLQDHTSVDVHILDDPEETAKQAAGMQNFFSRAPLENKEVKQAALTQIGLFNCIVGIAFLVDGNENRTNAIIDSVYRFAEKLSGFVLYPNMYLFHWSSKLLISIDGKTEMTEFHPVADARLLDKDLPESEADIARKNRSMAVCKEKGIYVPEHLRSYVAEAQCIIPEKDEILRRAVCIFATGVCSEIFREGGPRDMKQFVEIMNTLEKQYGFQCSLSPKEQDYLKNPLQHEKEHILYDWRYEDCAVLLWALSLMDLGEPDHTCDVSSLGKLIFSNDFDTLFNSSTLRSREEILDLQDLIFRYDWACVEARVNGSHPEALDPSVVYEWHYALNWLTGADGITQWDQVRPNT